MLRVENCGDFHVGNCWDVGGVHFEGETLDPGLSLRCLSCEVNSYNNVIYNEMEHPFEMPYLSKMSH